MISFPDWPVWPGEASSLNRAPLHRGHPEQKIFDSLLST